MTPILDWFNQIAFTVNGTEINWLQVCGVILSVLLAFLIYRLLMKSLLPRLLKNLLANQAGRRRLGSRLTWLLIFGLFYTAIRLLGLDFTALELNENEISVSLIILLVLLITAARLIDSILSEIVLEWYSRLLEHRGGKPAVVPKLSNVFSVLLYLFLGILVLRMAGWDWIIFEQENYTFRLSSLLQAILAIVFAQLIIWIVIQILNGYYYKQGIDTGSRHAFNQLVKYVIYTFAFILAMQYLGFHLTVILGGAAALLVGVGLGLQSIFSDFVSGFILLFDRAVEAGDTVQVDEFIGTVTHIGLRTSKVITRHNIVVVVPNSKLVQNKVINWSNNDHKARFTIEVPVMYGSDTARVRQLLLETASRHGKVYKDPKPFVRLIRFGEYALHFELSIWSSEFLFIEDVKSDLRFAIEQAFKREGIQIPVPHRDVNIRLNPTQDDHLPSV